jgi:hypothetical protein
MSEPCPHTGCGGQVNNDIHYFSLCFCGIGHILGTDTDVMWSDEGER